MVWTQVSIQCKMDTIIRVCGSQFSQKYLEPFSQNDMMTNFLSLSMISGLSLNHPKESESLYLRAPATEL
jgi:hypothetical protein